MLSYRARSSGWLAVALLMAALVGACSRAQQADRVSPAGEATSSSVGAGAPSAAAPAAGTSADPSATASVAKTGPSADPLGGREWPPAVVDMHVDTPWRVHLKDRPLGLPKGHVTAETARAGGYAGVVWVIYIPDYLHKNHPRISDAEEIFGIIGRMVGAHETFQFSPAAGQHRALLPPPRDEKVTVFVAIEGAGAFAEDIEQIDRFIERGVRMVGLVHAHHNDFASSATDKRKREGGLTELGKKFCERIYRQGALVDVSHMSDAAFWDLVPIAEAAGAPIVATHSNARKLRNHARNLTDEQLRAIAKSGGVAGLNLHRSFVRRKSAKLEHAADHAMHMIEVAGIDHVGLGSDFDGGRPVKGLQDASKWPDLAEELRKRELGDDGVRKVFSRNALRVLAWRPGESR